MQPAPPTRNPTPTAADWILHVDLDQFIAAVEIIRRPELRGRPVVVGTSSDPTRRRAVVMTASYEARAFGIRSGMPLRTAARRCPEAVFLASDPPAYEAASHRVMATLRSFPVRVEVAGWDEAFLGVNTEDPETIAAAIQREVERETGLACSIGIGDNKLCAKLATGFAKPAGVARLSGETWMSVMAERPVDALWGVGSRTARNLAELGIRTVGELATADRGRLIERFGPTMGPWFRSLGRGEGSTEIFTEPWVARSRSHETTFLEDLTDPTEIADQVVRLARTLALEARDDGRMVARVAVKVRYAPFFTSIRSSTLPAATDDPVAIEDAALSVLDRFDRDRPVRLLGVRVEFER